MLTDLELTCSCFPFLTGNWVLYSAVLLTREEFLKVLNLASIDVVTVKLRLDRKVSMGKFLFLTFTFLLLCVLLSLCYRWLPTHDRLRYFRIFLPIVTQIYYVFRFFKFFPYDLFFKLCGTLASTMLINTASPCGNMVVDKLSRRLKCRSLYLKSSVWLLNWWPQIANR